MRHGGVALQRSCSGTLKSMTIAMQLTAPGIPRSWRFWHLRKTAQRTKSYELQKGLDVWLRFFTESMPLSFSNAELGRPQKTRPAD
jgi:hypothetical protein